MSKDFVHNGGSQWRISNLKRLVLLHYVTVGGVEWCALGVGTIDGVLVELHQSSRDLRRN